MQTFTINMHEIFPPSKWHTRRTALTGKQDRIYERRPVWRHNVNNQTMKWRIHRTPVHRAMPE